MASRIYALGSAVLFATSFPSMMGKDLSIGGFSAGAILIAVGFGGLQASLQPVIGKSLWLLILSGHRDSFRQRISTQNRP